MKTSDKIELVAAALVEAQKEMGNAVKDSSNPFFKSKYADLLSIREAILPVTTKFGLSVLQLPATLDGKNYIETVVMHSSGQFLSSMDEVVVSKQNDPQSKLAAQTYTRRGSLQAFFNIGCEDDDGNYASGKAPSIQAQPAKPSSQPANPPPAASVKPAPAPSAGGFGGGFGASASKPAAAPEVKQPAKAPARSGSFGQ
jgi:hypothetical protein